MGRLRCSIGWLMIVVAVAAVEFATMRALVRSGTGLSEAILMTLPMLNLLAIGLVVVQRLRGRTRAFLVGFEAFGWLTIAACALDYFCGCTFLQVYASTCEPIFESIVNELGIRTGSEIGKDDSSALSWLIAVALELAFFLPPQLMPALIGGWLTLRYRVRITIERRWPFDPEAGEAREPGPFVLPDEGLIPGLELE